LFIGFSLSQTDQIVMRRMRFTLRQGKRVDAAKRQLAAFARTGNLQFGRTKWQV
jgi:hypothetical protein